ncbi:MAG: peptidoglycan DD-metalloendopeptidase family protein [Chloroflexota bacterium]|jgi:murein DD-endopeptidase MepM/ murein hydrolase activator NlpD
MTERSSNSTSLLALVVLAFLLFNLFNDQANANAIPTEPAEYPLLVPTAEPQPSPTPPDPLAIRAPYEEYILTQGPHGQSYGHYAIDLTAGKGAAILSPINGIVTAHYMDQYGNTTLIIENEVWQVLMLHGDYSVEVEQVVTIGQPVGAESNHGYTVDWRGQSCRGRDCGYHTHLNIFDKRIGSNVDPLDVLAP